MDTKKFIIIIVIVLAILVLLIVLVPKIGKVDCKKNPNDPKCQGGGGGVDCTQTPNAPECQGGGGGGGGNTSNRNYDASTWKVGDKVFASQDTAVICDDCWTPNWLLDITGNNYHFTTGSDMGTFVSFSGSILTTKYDGNNYLSYISNRPYTLR